jgi:TusA-related sulfurtransferase
MNFVKTRLFLDKIASGDLLEVQLDNGEPVDSVSASVAAEGHTVEKIDKKTDFSILSIRKL